jgi:hypothetical protein
MRHQSFADLKARAKKLAAAADNTGLSSSDAVALRLGVAQVYTNGSGYRPVRRRFPHH